ncbi:hypothetical protein Lesp02_11390 [Lentzea sp. NBRC 105346]|uniref:hypothetical protein n=1 Tax=Lentzea sp. NBRC 105346 TaxID=3032205 RepID=UPI0024A14A2A|nr:hypothetical protein [Lentzea sp. NBRC 105346]GLZ28949.1 hypothetical protein Lesp02_11390 [Lentzea sp. NBRC 105346]
MRMTKLAGTCDDGIDCPAVFLTERGTIAVQGDLVDYINTPLGEAIVEIPVALLLEAANATP